jgi:hypothetical protein
MQNNKSSVLALSVRFQMTQRLDLYAKELQEVIQPEYKQNIIKEQ